MQVLGYEVAALNTVQFSKLRLPSSSSSFQHEYIYTYNSQYAKWAQQRRLRVLANKPTLFFFSKAIILAMANSKAPRPPLKIFNISTTA